MHVWQHNVKATLTANGCNDWSEGQKVRYLIIVINTKIVGAFFANISGLEVLCDDFDVAARHVNDFLVIMNYRDPVINHNISDVENDQGDGSSRGRGGGPGRGGRGGVVRCSRGGVGR